MTENLKVGSLTVVKNEDGTYLTTTQSGFFVKTKKNSLYPEDLLAFIKSSMLN